MYYQFNITTYKEGYPECVLIRSLEPINSKENSKGPGKLCQYLKLDSSFWGEDICKSKKIWFMNGDKINKNDIIKTKRIGIDYAGEDKNLPWRFYITNNQWVSRK
jgi:DNA-3-methyladenine glycosylase